MGDSYIAGEGGRWKGNSNREQSLFSWARQADQDLTDRVKLDKRKISEIYNNTWDDEGCHRSDSAEIFGALRPSAWPDKAKAPGILRVDPEPDKAKDDAKLVDNVVNIACSGAETKDFSQRFKGEQPQIKQLKDLLDKRNRETLSTVFVSVGGNDLNLSGVATDCATRWFKGWLASSCQADDKVKNAVDSRIKDLKSKIMKTVGLIQGALLDGPERSRGARIVIQSYPNPVVGQSKIRFHNFGYQRYAYCGAPFNNETLEFLRDTSKKLDDMYFEVAKEMNADSKKGAKANISFLSLRKLFDGHEVCSTDSVSAIKEQVSAGKAEWARYVYGASREIPLVGKIIGVKAEEVQESLHPNFYGQQALQYCARTFLRRSELSAGHPLPAPPLYAECVGRKGLNPEKVTVGTRS
ncbi:hypothetical protein SSP35_54_00040 [Streptomyces sp. NBRC 110611]|nr:hypothetical protein SSP35_54_00040 [Streptomyces sp. NBRC 110611]